MIDLHTHTTASDGNLSPVELVQKAMKRNITHLAITDHDTIDGIQEALDFARSKNITIIPGIEISCKYAAGEVHVLGLWIDHTNQSILDFVANLQRNRDNRNRQILRKMLADKLFEGEENLLMDDFSVTGRPHIARILKQHGIVSTVNEAFERFLAFGKPYYLPRPLPTPEKAFSIIKEAGGLSFIAHPNTLIKDNPDITMTTIETHFRTWKALGLNGIEVFHSMFRPIESRTFRRIATKLYLLTSGGSDFHGLEYDGKSLGKWHKQRRIPVGIINSLTSKLSR